MGKFRDVYRQAAIDAMLGVESLDRNLESEELASERGQPSDHFELSSLDPMLVGRGGGALLKDVGNRVTNRLSRLKGRFYVRATPVGGGGGGARQAEADDTRPSKLEASAANTLDGLNIDWPSSESIESSMNANIDRQTSDIFKQLSKSEDSFRDDDEFSELVLSIDFAEMQRVQERREAERGGEREQAGGESGGSRRGPEEIDMTEARGVRRGSREKAEVATTVMSS